MIGFINICHPDYAGGLSTELAKEALDRLKAKNIPVMGSCEPVTDHHHALRESRKMIEADIDGVILFYGAFILCSTAMVIVSELRLPLLHWGVPMTLQEGHLATTGSYVAFSMFNGTLNRLGIAHENLIAEPDSAEALNKVNDFALAANAVKRLRRSRAGLVGYTSMSIYPGTFDHVLLRWLIGPEIEHIDSYTLINKAEAIEDTADILKLYEKEICWPKKAPELMRQRAAKIYGGLRELCQENDLQAITVKCQYEFSKEYGMTPCLPLSLLADHGVVTSCEGDIPCLVSSMILNYLSGQTATYGDAIHHQGNIVKFSPCGYMPFSMGNPGMKNTMVSEYPQFQGLMCSFVMKPGKVTILRLVEEIGTYSLLCFTGTGIESELRGGNMPSLDVVIDGDVQKLVNLYPGQHFAICYGDYLDRVDMLARMLGIRVTKI